VCVCDSGVSVWLRIAVPCGGPLLMMFKIDPKFNSGNIYRTFNDEKHS